MVDGGWQSWGVGGGLTNNNQYEPRPTVNNQNKKAQKQGQNACRTICICGHCLIIPIYYIGIIMILLDRFGQSVSIIPFLGTKTKPTLFKIITPTSRILLKDTRTRHNACD